jgi:hypothetical protein
LWYPHARFEFSSPLEQIMTVPTNIRATVSEEGVLFMDISCGKMFFANRIGKGVWLAMQAGTPLTAIADEISVKFAVPVVQVESDVRDFVANLRLNGLLVQD